MNAKFKIGDELEPLTESERKFSKEFAKFLLKRRKFYKNIKKFTGTEHILDITDYESFSFVREYNKKNNESIDLLRVIGSFIRSISSIQKVHSHWLYTKRYYCRVDSHKGFYVYTNSKDGVINTGIPTEHTSIGVMSDSIWKFIKLFDPELFVTKVLKRN